MLNAREQYVSRRTGVDLFRTEFHLIATLSFSPPSHSSLLHFLLLFLSILSLLCYLNVQIKIKWILNSITLRALHWSYIHVGICALLATLIHKACSACIYFRCERSLTKILKHLVPYHYCCSLFPSRGSLSLFLAPVSLFASFSFQLAIELGCRHWVPLNGQNAERMSQ